MKKTDKATIAARIDELLLIRLEGAAFWDCRAYIGEKTRESGSVWEAKKCLSDAQIYRYLKRVDKLIADDCRTSRKHLMRRHLAQRRHLYGKAVNQGDVRTALAVLADEARLEGLYEAFPDKMRKTTTEISAPMATADVVRVLSDRLREIDVTELPIAEKARLSAAIGDSLLAARNVEGLEAQVAELAARLDTLTAKKKGK